MNKKQTILFLGGTGLVALFLLVLLIMLKQGQLEQTFNTLTKKEHLPCQQKLKSWRAVDAKEVCSQFASSFPFAAEVNEINAKQVSAPEMNYDHRAVIRLYDSADAVTRDSYCYFIFKKYLGDGSIDPKTFGEVVSGFSILANEIPTYRAWLQSNLGTSCILRVKQAIGVEPSDLSFLQGKSLVALYPLGAFQEGMTIEQLKIEVAITLNHERIHLLENDCPEFNNYQEEFYSQANPQEIAQMAERFPSYDWNDPIVAAKEYLAFSFESDPLQLEKVLGCSSK